VIVAADAALSSAARSPCSHFLCASAQRARRAATAALSSEALRTAAASSRSVTAGVPSR
jgi:hypothetical protein